MPTIREIGIFLLIIFIAVLAFILLRELIAVLDNAPAAAIRQLTPQHFNFRIG